MKYDSGIFLTWLFSQKEKYLFLMYERSLAENNNKIHKINN